MRVATVAAVLGALILAGSAPAVPAPHRCSTSRLHIWVTRTGAAAGTVGGYLAFANRNRSVCTLRGWPTLTALRPGASTTAVHVHATMFGPYVGGNGPFVRSVPTVVLRHGQAAVAAFTAGDNGPGPTGACPPPYHQLRVTPPGNTAGVLLSAWIAWYDQYLPSCTQIEESMVVPWSDMPPRSS